MIHVKSEKEIELIREACRVVKATFDFVSTKIKAGMTTKELDTLIERFIRSEGANPSCLGYCGYPASACISINEVVVHGIPDERVIQDGDIVSVDIVADKNGYHGDAARTFLVGSVSPEKKRLVEVTKECFFKGIENLMVGSTLGDIGGAIQEHAESNGYSVVREMVGHGIGRNLHEDPAVPNYGRRRTGIRLRRGMALAIEPMINMGRSEVVIDGWSCVTKDKMPSAHYENTVVITDEGVEILTLR